MSAGVIYLASPGSGLQADAARGMPWLMSFATWKPFLREWMPSAQRVLLDSGAFSEFNTGAVIDPEEYAEWAAGFSWCDAWAALDDIRGDTERTLRNSDQYGGFPTFHETDALEALPEFIELARKRGSWLGLGCIPPRVRKGDWLRTVCERIPSDLHVHGWALVPYLHTEPRLDSADSTEWWRDAMALKARVPQLRHLTMGECLEIKVKQYQRYNRRAPEAESDQYSFPDAGYRGTPPTAGGWK